MSYTHIYDSSKLEAFIHRNPVTTAETSVEDNSVVRWDVGSLINIQDSSILIDDEGDIVIPTGSNVVFEDTGNLTFTESGGSDTITVKGAGSIGVNHKLVLPGITGATGNALAVESIVGDELRLSWEEQTSLGPGSNVTDNAIVLWDGSSGNKIKNSSVLVNDNDGITIPVSYNLVFNNTGPLTFKEIGGGNTLKLQSNDSLIGNTVLTLPNSAGTSSQVLTTDGSDVATLSWGSAPSFSSIDPVVPKYDFSNFSYTGLNEYLRLNQGYNSLMTGSIPRPNSGVNSAYRGAVYSPTDDRLYFTPSFQATHQYWHYINSAGTGIPYDNNLGTLPVQEAYNGGSYAPTLNRIYFAPWAQADEKGTLPANSQWHYIQCGTDPPTVVAYDTGFATSNFYNNAYRGTVYSPTQNRIYFCPSAQISKPSWHYIDCSDGSVQFYSTTAVTVKSSGGAYNGGVYSPLENRIYFAPSIQSNKSKWHYIDCSDGSIVEYTHGVSVVSNGYCAGTYAPTLNRIYFAPLSQATQTTWHYIECDGSNPPNVQGYPVTPTQSYVGSVYFPQQNRIYFIPANQQTLATWHYINGSDGSVGSYTHNSSQTQTFMYHHGGLHPTLNRLYFSPFNAADDTDWFYLTDTNATGMNVLSKVLMSGGLYNNSFG